MHRSDAPRLDMSRRGRRGAPGAQHRGVVRPVPVHLDSHDNVPVRGRRTPRRPTSSSAPPRAGPRLPAPEASVWTHRTQAGRPRPAVPRPPGQRIADHRPALQVRCSRQVDDRLPVGLAELAVLQRAPAAKPVRLHPPAVDVVTPAELSPSGCPRSHGCVWTPRPRTSSTRGLRGIKLGTSRV